MNILEARRRTLGKGVYKKTVEGNPAIAQGSLARMYPGITMQGWTEQAQHDGKNLFNLVRLLSLIPEIGSDNDNIVVKVAGLKPNTYYTLSSTIEGYVGGAYTNRCLYFGGCETSDAVFVDHPVSKSSGGKGEIEVFFYPFRDFSQDIKSGRGNVQLEEGTVATTYEPYTGGQPSPSPDYPQEIVSAGKYNEDTQKWEYEVKLTGKNLLPYGEGNIKIGIPYEIRGRTYILNKDGSISITTQDLPESSTGNIFIFGAVGDRKHYKLPAGKYTVSTFNGNIPNMSIQLEDENSVNTRSVSVGTFELKEHERIAYAWLYGAAGTEWNGTIYPQLEYGGVSTSYEQYKLPQTVTLTSDRPLTKWDKLEKRNGQWGWVYKSNTVTLDGSEDEKWEFDAYLTNKYMIQLSDGILGENIFGYCNRFIFGGPYEVDRIGINVNAILWITINWASSNLTLWKNYLAQNPITVIYPTSEETFIPLTESEQEQMNSLCTFRPTTVLSNDCGCNMTLTYKTKKSLEVTT